MEKANIEHPIPARRETSNVEEGKRGKNEDSGAARPEFLFRDPVSVLSLF
jgi:hypothetical protein